MKLTLRELNKVSSIFQDIGQILFAVLFIGPIVGGEIDFIKITMGLFTSSFLWYSSVAIINPNK
jgi:hypothetical protein